MAKDKKKDVADEEVIEQTEVTEETPSKEEEFLRQLEEKNDQLLRMAAEYDNFRKRSQREKEALYAECKASVINSLLPVADNFDRIFENPDGTLDDYKKGVEMTFKQFSEVFKSLGIESFGEVGEEFDPNIHNAVMHTEDDSVGENVITTVIVKGYKLGDKIIRPAMVAVAN